MSDQGPNTLGPLDQGEVIPEYQAKQGRRGLHIFGVLVVSLALGDVAHGSVGVFHAHKAADSTPAAAAARTVGTSNGG